MKPGVGRSPWILVAGIFTAGLLGYTVAVRRSGGAAAAVSTLRGTQLAIEEQAEASVRLMCGHELSFIRGEAVTGVRPVAVLPLERSSPLLVDNRSGGIFRLGIGLAGVRAASEFPAVGGANGAVEHGGRFYISLGTSIHSISIAGQRPAVVHTDLAVWDFDVLDSGSFVVNAYVRNAAAAPWIYLLGPDGLLRRTFGRHGLTQPGGLDGLAAAASDGSKTVLVAAVHVPKFEIFSMGDGTMVPVQLRLPGQDAVAALAENPALVQVGHGEIALPSFAAGVAWTAPVYDILVDAPWPLLFQVRPDGRVAGCEIGRRLDEFEQFRGLFSAGNGVFYSIGIAPDGARRVYKLWRGR